MAPTRQTILVIASISASILIAKRRRKRRWWVRPGRQLREKIGEYHGLYFHLRENDPELFKTHFRISPNRFDHLLSLLEHHLRRNLHGRAPVSPAERLAITLCFLATGSSQTALSIRFGRGQSTISQILTEILKF